MPDAQYLADQARRQFERQQEAQRLQTEQGQDATDTQEAIRRLLARVGDDRQQISNTANKQGLAYSGHLVKGLDDYQAGVTRQQGDLKLNMQRRTDARAAARAALEQGATVEEAAARAEAAERQVGRDSEDASLGMLAVPAAPAAAAPARPRLRRGTPQPTTTRRRRPRRLTG